MHDGPDGKLHVFYEDKTFVGFVAAIIYKDIVNILYLAVDKLQQGKGYGHQILEQLKEMYPKHRIIADIEKFEEHCINPEMRRKRELFYLHDSFKESEIEYKFKGVDFIIMIANGSISKEEFKAFWTHFAHFDDLGKYIKNNFTI